MRRLWGLSVFAILATFLANATLVQAAPQGQGVDQPVSKADVGDGENDDDEEDDLPDPPPFFGEDGGIGEKMKIVWCLDRSGSMSYNGGTFTGPDGNPMTGSRWDRCKAEASIALSQLTPEWEFGVLTYACNRDKYKPDLVPAEASEVSGAIAWLNGHFPWGGTGTGPAQAEAFHHADGGTVEGSATCWLRSEGQPNCGAQGTTGHKAIALAANGTGHVLNTVGIADTGRFAAFMRELAEATGGVYVHVQ
ncbi:MAG: VWA domain-containing protein [Planctomycetota bacterium]|nr:VWA domain-containing protein [Planctomycetota bacterium]